jgi:magnesium chelatase subunit I
LDEQKEIVQLHPLAEDLIEQIAMEARASEYVDAKSGVSARLTISALENLVSAAERRSLRNAEDTTHIRIADFWGIVPSITGKIELVYEGEQEGPANVAQILVGKAIRSVFTEYFPDPETQKRKKEKNPYQPVLQWFSKGNMIDLLNDTPDFQYQEILQSIPGLKELIVKFHPNSTELERLFYMEFALHGLAEYSLISKGRLDKGLQFKDLLSGMFSMPGIEEEEI